MVKFTIIIYSYYIIIWPKREQHLNRTTKQQQNNKKIDSKIWPRGPIGGGTMANFGTETDHFVIFDQSTESDRHQCLGWNELFFWIYCSCNISTRVPGMDIPDDMMTRAVILDRHTRVALATWESCMILIRYHRGKSNTFDQSDLTSYGFLSSVPNRRLSVQMIVRLITPAP